MIYLSGYDDTDIAYKINNNLLLVCDYLCNNDVSVNVTECK